MYRISAAICCLAYVNCCQSAPEQEPSVKQVQSPERIISEAPETAPQVVPAAFQSYRQPTKGELSDTALILWATNYYTPIYTSQDMGIPLIGQDNQSISGNLSRENWCNVALQGSASIADAEGVRTAYVFVDSKGVEQVNCDDQFPSLSTNILVHTRKARFMAVRHPYGCGVQNYPLIPYRTIAVDKSKIAYETTLYIPALNGKVFEIDGVDFSHDGYVFAADKGGAIKLNHIDFFSGNSRRVAFTDVVTSNQTKTIEAFVVEVSNSAAIDLAALHAQPCN